MSSGPVSPTPGELTGATLNPDLVEVPPRVHLSLSGAGAPDSVEFGFCVGALYGVAYGLKFGRKKATGKDFKVGPLVGIWWAEGHDLAGGIVPPRDSWRWTVQLDVPPDVLAKDADGIIEAAVTKKGGKLEGSPHARRILLARDSARRFGRILHVGPYADEPRSFNAIGSLLASQGMIREPWHVEVYLSDPERTAPEKLKTVLLAPLSG